MKKIIWVITTVFILTASTSFAQYFFMDNQTIGKKAPDFSLPSIDGENIKFSEFRGDDKAIVFFWATWCPHCRTQLQELSKNSKAITDQGVKIIAVDYGEDVKTVKRYVERNNIDVPMVVDQENELEEKYSLIGVPTFFYVDNQGIVKASEHQLVKDIDAVFN